jgi:hypothetical protein
MPFKFQLNLIYSFKIQISQKISFLREYINDFWIDINIWHFSNECNILKNEIFAKSKGDIFL